MRNDCNRRRPAWRAAFHQQRPVFRVLGVLMVRGLGQGGCEPPVGGGLEVGEHGGDAAGSPAPHQAGSETATIQLDRDLANLEDGYRERLRQAFVEQEGQQDLDELPSPDGDDGMAVDPSDPGEPEMEADGAAEEQDPEKMARFEAFLDTIQRAPGGGFNLGDMYLSDDDDLLDYSARLNVVISIDRGYTSRWLAHAGWGT